MHRPLCSVSLTCFHVRYLKSSVPLSYGVAQCPNSTFRLQVASADSICKRVGPKSRLIILPDFDTLMVFLKTFCEGRFYEANGQQAPKGMQSNPACKELRNISTDKHVFLFQSTCFDEINFDTFRKSYLKTILI